MYISGVTMPTRKKIFIVSEEQQVAVDHISAGMSYAECARTLDIHLNTLYNWRQKPSFQFALVEAGYIKDNQSEEVLDAYIQGRVDGLVLSAMEALDLILRKGDSESAKVVAAKYVLETFRKATPEEQDMTEKSGISELKRALKLA
tara:strand:+ start:102 stop:539 length:438 start_codon:yes stop_codon:yes gene_type:complete